MPDVTATRTVRHDGKTYVKGDTISGLSQSQADALISVGSAETGAGKDVSSAGDFREVNTRMKKDDLVAVAGAEGVEGLEGTETKPQLVEAIEANRKAKAEEAAAAQS